MSDQTFVYILSTYQEGGAEDVRATTDPKKVQSLLDHYDATLEERAAATEIVNAGKPTGEYGGDLSEGWGGIKLYVVELE